MNELELIKKLNQISFNDKEMSKEFSKWDIKLKEVDDFVLHYDPDYKVFDIGIVMNNGYDGYDICYRDLKDFDFLNTNKNKLFESLNQSPMAIANYLLIESKFSINQIELNKLVYLTYSYFLAISNKKIFDESFESSIYGPILPSVYHTYKSFKLDNINKFMNEFGYNESTKQFEIYFESFKNIDKETQDLITLVASKVYENYNQYTMLELIDITNKEGSPNKIALKNNNEKLDDNLIFEYYDSMYDSIITNDDINELDKNLEIGDR